LNSEVVDSKSFTDIILKMSNINFLTKVNFTNSEKDKSIKNGNLLVTINIFEGQKYFIERINMAAAS